MSYGHVISMNMEGIRIRREQTYDPQAVSSSVSGMAMMPCIFSSKFWWIR